jgi:glycine betaine/proline transport system substrate-binding protein
MIHPRSDRRGRKENRVTTRGNRLRRIGLAVTGILALGALSACGSPAPAVIAAPGAAETACGTLRLAVNPWVGYEANAAVVSYLARQELGCEVKLVKETEAESWKHLSEGKVDAILENWGHDELKKKYIDSEKVAVEAGLTGNRGVIGWYVPPWMVKEYPDITNWRNLRKYTDLFKTTSSGGKGQLLDGDPTYVTNDKALVKNLKLNYKVVFAGSEDALIAAFRKAETNKTPLLGYFYSPQWLLSEIDLVNIPLPAYTPGCDNNPGTIVCDYQPYDLDKIANKKFAYSGSPAATLIKNFKWTNDDQNEVARDMTEQKLSADEAAKKWLDANRPVWTKWLPSRA